MGWKSTGGGGASPTWSSHSVVWTAVTTNPVIGNGTLTGKYQQNGDIVIYQVSITMGSTTTFGSGEWEFDLPVTPADLVAIGPALAWDSGTLKREGIAWLRDTSTLQMVSDVNASDWKSDVPHTWATGDILRISIIYEAT